MMEENKNEVTVVETETAVEETNNEGSSLGALVLVGAGALGTVAVIGAVKGVKAIGRKIKSLRKKPEIVETVNAEDLDCFEDELESEETEKVK